VSKLNRVRGRRLIQRNQTKSDLMMKVDLSIENPWYLPYDQKEQDFLTKMCDLFNKQKASTALARQEEKIAYQKLQADKETFNYERALVNIYKRRLGMAVEQVGGTAQSKPVRALEAELARKTRELNIIKQRLQEVDVMVQKVQKKRPKLFDPCTIAQRRLQIHLYESRLKVAGDFPMGQTRESERFKATFSEQKRLLWQNYIETHASIISRLRVEIETSSQRFRSTRSKIQIAKRKKEIEEKLTKEPAPLSNSAYPCDEIKAKVDDYKHRVEALRIEAFKQQRHAAVVRGCLSQVENHVEGVLSQRKLVRDGLREEEKKREDFIFLRGKINSLQNDLTAQLEFGSQILRSIISKVSTDRKDV